MRAAATAGRAAVDSRRFPFQTERARRIGNSACSRKPHGAGRSSTTAGQRSVESRGRIGLYNSANNFAFLFSAGSEELGAPARPGVPPSVGFTLSSGRFTHEQERPRRLCSPLPLLAAPAAWAGNGHTLHGVGAVNSSMGGAGVALPIDTLGGLLLNPALATRHGRQPLRLQRRVQHRQERRREHRARRPVGPFSGRPRRPATPPSSRPSASCITPGARTSPTASASSASPASAPTTRRTPPTRSWRRSPRASAGSTPTTSS